MIITLDAEVIARKKKRESSSFLDSEEVERMEVIVKTISQIVM